MEYSDVTSSHDEQRKAANVQDGDWYEDDLEDSFDTYGIKREHDNRCNQFHTIGYRDGLLDGKEASAQDGFNVGFKQSVPVGYDLGLVRGVTSALATLPEHLKDRLAGTKESKTKLDNLHQSVQLITTNDALKIHASASLNETDQIHLSSQGNPGAEFLFDEQSHDDNLGKFSRDLHSLLKEFPEIRLQSRPLQR